MEAQYLRICLHTVFDELYFIIFQKEQMLVPFQHHTDYDNIYYFISQSVENDELINNVGLIQHLTACIDP